MGRRATIVGSGPNGLAAAVSLARAGYETTVLEAAETPGGGIRTLEAPEGWQYDVCSAVHPAALTSPFFTAFGLREKVDWIVPEISYAHPLDGGRAALAWRDLDRTAEDLGSDAAAWRALLRPLSTHLHELVDLTGSHLLRVPRYPVIAARFAARVAQSSTRAGHGTLRTVEARALLSGVLAHAIARQPSFGAAASGLLLAAHAHSDMGWAYPRGGAGRIADALIADLDAHGGHVQTASPVRSLEHLDWGDPGAGDVLILDTTPRLLLTHPDLPTAYARAVRRYRYGGGAAKVDFLLDGPVPWANADVARSPTVHVGGTRAEVEASENAVARGQLSERPFALVVQPSVFDATRATDGHHVVWAYIHVPSGSTTDATALITAQLERFAPGFSRGVIASRSMTAAERAEFNPADIGGDILGGQFTLAQAIRRPVVARVPWRTPLPGVYLGSAASPPGPGVTGLPGWYAARQALRDGLVGAASLSDLFGERD
ncbi:NAD(P)/FAD-dependent oxidoreductase [Microbacterium sp. C7(2022)]|uniref:phytoene desaturase family protein n=1 Tax=Microbacterium sp. C7(2022) TaxID=2992759 RepID=UPI00237C34E3|nr:NAD(P)/FAD-dependent oxidoreductase [Microbacterium sp. C7(2022)]MDE0546193.1 NAD(P)/FAD-dependent oxidoreductase [Microbacterium sp. C7(2022)]